MSLQPYQQQVIDEKTNLDNKRSRLAEFKNTEIYEQLPKEEKDRLEHQAFHMLAYSDILTARIEAF